MKELRSYHCNLCGALLFVGEAHKCDPARLAIVDRIADLLGRSSDISLDEVLSDLNHKDTKNRKN